MNAVSLRRVGPSELPFYELSRCERQIMEAIYQLDRASVRDICQLLPHNAHYSTVRATLTNLERKGFLYHEHRQRRYIYRPLVSREEACQQSLRHITEVFFSGSIEGVVSTLLRAQKGDYPASSAVKTKEHST